MIFSLIFLIIFLVGLVVLVQKVEGDILYQIIPRKPRFLNAIISVCGGYFWLPCRLCGKKFAGYEWKESISTWAGGEGVCYRCSDKARAINDEYFKNIPPPPFWPIPLPDEQKEEENCEKPE